MKKFQQNKNNFTTGKVVLYPIDNYVHQNYSYTRGYLSSLYVLQ